MDLEILTRNDHIRIDVISIVFMHDTLELVQAAISLGSVIFPFIADASVTLARRGLHGEKVWQAHREHYYQRMVQSGFGHRNTALLGYLLMLAAGASAIWAMRQHIAVQLGVGIAWCAIYLVMMRV